MQGHLFNPAPRIGFAFDPKGDGKTAIRAGYGIFFEHANGNEGNTESLENSPPLATTVQQNFIPGYALIGSSVGQAQAQLPLNVVAIPTKAVWPYVQQWHLDVQRDLIRNTVLTVSYVGSKGTHLNRQTDLNQLFPLAAGLNPFKPGEPNTCATNAAGTAFLTPSNVVIGPGSPGFVNMEVSCGSDPAGNSFDPNTVRPLPGYADITNLQFAASSNYNALQSSLRHQLGGLQLTVAYTYSHSIDDASDRGDASFVDSYHPFLNRASSNFDQRHIFNLSYVYDLPFFRKPGLTNKLLGGWQWSGITTFQTGTPYSVFFSSDNAGVANGIGSSSRADIIGNPYSGIQKSPLQAFGPLYANPSAFAAPQGLTFGDSGRNLLTNPHTTNFDMALFKHFGITEHTAFEFRAEAFNVFNHTQWWGVGGDVGSGTNNVGIANNTFSTDPTSGFLRVSAAHNPRILQLGLKFLF
ncbi:MAG: hypothetical protein JO249_10450 [Acidobacteria bacterium]|nr:hypothetical protein [Acidobacteriota bacterium]